MNGGSVESDDATEPQVGPRGTLHWACGSDVVLGMARWPDKAASFCPGPPGALKRPSRSPQ
jgi:hypothetical protein